MKKHDNSLLS